SSQVTISGIAMDKHITSINEGMNTETYLVSLDEFNYLEVVFRYAPGDDNQSIFSGMINTFTLFNQDTQEEAENVFEYNSEGDYVDDFDEDF
ncbi:hypothetical protein ACFL2C_01445, partial [Patescibacteria group bacterium]